MNEWGRNSNPLAPTTSGCLLLGCSMVESARRIIVRGRVQGVGFRAFVQRAGKRLGLTGDVCNLPDASVKIVVEGTAEVLEEFIREVRKGPPASRVERLEIHDIAVSGRYPTFLIEGW
jgi:acylphosphatase